MSTPLGQIPHRSAITNITNAFPCVVTIEDDIELSSGDFVRLTGLNGMMPIPRGMEPLNNYRFKVELVDATSFKLKHPVTDKYVNSTNYPPYVTGGSCNKIEPNFIFYGDEE